jgi:predicted DNA-binding protein
VCSYQDDTPEIREAMLKEASERMPKRRNFPGGHDIIDLEIMAKRSDYERVFPPKSVERDKQWSKPRGWKWNKARKAVLCLVGFARKRSRANKGKEGFRWFWCSISDTLLDQKEGAMPTKNTRINVVVEKPLYAVIDEISKERGISKSMVVRDLVMQAIELREDMALVRFADERAKSFDTSKAQTHKEVWK